MDMAVLLAPVQLRRMIVFIRDAPSRGLTNLAVEPPPNDAAPGAYYPPPPPMRDMARKPQADPIGKRSDEHNDGHNKRAHALAATNAIEPRIERGSDNGSSSSTPTPSYPCRNSKPPSRTQRREAQTRRVRTPFNRHGAETFETPTSVRLGYRTID